jgi:hypothetical protein
LSKKQVELYHKRHAKQIPSPNAILLGLMVFAEIEIDLQFLDGPADFAPEYDRENSLRILTGLLLGAYAMKIRTRPPPKRRTT